MRKGFVYVSILCFLFSFGIVKTIYGENDVQKKPNVLLVLTDQMTATALSCAGNSYLHTPALDKLAESGIRFIKNYVTQPLCLPFRSSLQTSRYPHEIGTVNNGEKIKGNFPMLGNLVASVGYQCEYIGKWHVGTTPEKAGYNNYNKAGIDEKKTAAAIDFLKAKHDKPFFLTVSFMNPHNVCQLARANAVGSDLPDGPIALPPLKLDDLPPLPDNFAVPQNEPTIIREIQHKSKVHYPTENWGELTWRQYLWGYYRLVEKVDSEIGKVLNILEKSNYADNTLVIFTSDHGEGVAMHHWNQKQILYDESVKVPLIISWKGETKKRVYRELVSNALDIPVTILDVTGAEMPSSMRGNSLLPILKGKSPAPREYVVSETMFARGAVNLGATGRMIRTKKYKYCIYDNGKNREQLFNLENDPGEMINLANKKEFQDELQNHRKLITKWADSTNDNGFPYIY